MICIRNKIIRYPKRFEINKRTKNIPIPKYEHEKPIFDEIQYQNDEGKKYMRMYTGNLIKTTFVRKY